eukprot:CAMPEP_0182418806 /NCGR_PEP_ID=MMETSP1167-20130531/3180_1 /TAXON_ID=2988 /ORGANISM="Mallomonas Sp, Strain CCMP3275" /LENGTH=194 /DNA_ID=CAMNT_0024593209 /DNA_START=153 /DNA_END=734 /DNA_ORIENTATION=-
MLSELLPEEKRRLHCLETQLLEIEKEFNYSGSKDFDLGLKDMCLRLDELEKLANKESLARRDDMKRRVQHLRTSYNHMKSSYDNILRRFNDQNFDAKKFELIGGIEADAIRFDLEAGENSSLSRSGQMLNDYIATGRESLSELISQRERMKSIQRKVFDILRYLGISNSIMQIVERREGADKWLVIAGMIGTTS